MISELINYAPNNLNVGLIVDKFSELNDLCYV